MAKVPSAQQEFDRFPQNLVYRFETMSLEGNGYGLKDRHERLIARKDTHENVWNSTVAECAERSRHQQPPNRP